MVRKKKLPPGLSTVKIESKLSGSSDVTSGEYAGWTIVYIDPLWDTVRFYRKLNCLVNMWLDFAGHQARRRQQVFITRRAGVLLKLQRRNGF